MALTASDLTVVEGDALISDAHLQAVLGYGRINDLHRVILKHQDELQDYGAMLCRTGKASSGQNTLSYYLNKEQAALVCVFSRTTKARAARKVIVEVFIAWQEGRLPPAPEAANPFAKVASRAGAVSDHLQAIASMPALARNATNLPVWRNGRRPPYWSNYPLRAFLTECHRQMTLAECCSQAQQRFGVKVSASSLQRYWAKLDSIVGPGRAA